MILNSQLLQDILQDIFTFKKNKISRNEIRKIKKIVKKEKKKNR